MQSPNYPAALVLFFLPAVSVELLTGDTPLATYLNPVIFVVLNLTYGATLLLIRETVMRWGKGFASVLVLAAGYGLLNEAIDTKGFFAPHFYAVAENGLVGFGRCFGINVPWAVNISIFHAVFSIMVPLAIVSAVFQNPGRWIGNKLYAVVLVAVIGCSAFSFRVFSLAPDYYHYREGPGPILLVLALMAALVLLAWKLPKQNPPRWPLRLNAFVLLFTGYGYTVALLNFPHLVQKATGSPVLYVAFLLAFFVAPPLLLAFKAQEPTARAKVALVAGLLMPLMLSGIHRSAGTLVATVVLSILLLTAFWRNTGQATDTMRRS